MFRATEHGQLKPRPHSPTAHASVSHAHARPDIDARHLSAASADFPVHLMNSHSTFATIIPHVIVAVAPMSLSLLSAEILSTYGHSSKLYLFDVDDIVHQLPVQYSALFVFDKDYPPSLASICMSVVLIVLFLLPTRFSSVRAGLSLTLSLFSPKVLTTLLYCAAQTASVAAASWQALCFCS